MNRILLAALLLFVVPAQAQERPRQPVLSPFTRMWLQQQEGKALPEAVPGYVYKKDETGNLYISALVQTVPGFESRKLEDLGIHTGTIAGNVRTIQVPLDKVKQLGSIQGLDYIQLDEPVFPLMDSVRVATRADSVQRGINLPSAFTGKNVVVGIIDIGFDYTHPLFFDTTAARYRVRKVWEQKTSGTPPSGFLYGREMTDSTAMWAAGTDNAGQSHGTHVAGIAAGSGWGSSADNGRFRGIAFNTDVVLVGITPTPAQWQNTGMSDIIDGMNYIYSYAASVGKPAVVNLSWGCSVGPHDGLSLFSKAVDNLTGPGKLFACSAGNTGSDNIHLAKVFKPNDTLVSTVVTFDSYLGAQKTWVDIWGDSSKTFCAQISLVSNGVVGNATGFICLDNTLHNQYVIASTGDTCFVSFTTSSAEFNGKPRIFLNIYNKSNNSVVLTIKSTNASVHAWEGYVENSTGYYGAFTNGGLSWAVAGNNYFTISDWSATRSAIPVGAWAAKNSFTNVSSSTVSYTAYVSRGRLVPFSSRGPAADSSVRPFITAPGFCVGSGVNSYDASFAMGGGNYSSVLATTVKNGRTYPYASLSGTSMSSPVVSGVLALMLEADPSLTPQKAQSILAATAIQDTYTGTIPAAGTNLWGHGKVNAYAAVKKTLQQTSVGTIGETLAWSVFPNPASKQFQVTCTSTGKTDAHIEITDLNGRLMRHMPWQVSNGYNHTTVDLNGLAKGLYLVKLSTGKGSATVKLLVD